MQPGNRPLHHMILPEEMAEQRFALRTEIRSRRMATDCAVETGTSQARMGDYYLRPRTTSFPVPRPQVGRACTSATAAVCLWAMLTSDWHMAAIGWVLRSVSGSIILGIMAVSAMAQDAAAPAGRAGANLIYNGDFEKGTGQMPPAGWVMWGSAEYARPENYVADTQIRHAGLASFRIIHPANTRGYVVTDPQHAIRPRRGMMYEISFWARSDRPGKSAFGLVAYQTIKPFVDAPGPGSYNIEVDPQWKQFTFTVREGWDFVARTSAYVMLRFSASGDDSEARTLWVDDVVVRELPSDREGRLVDPDMVTHPPLQHRLRPGATLTVTVDPARRIGPATLGIGGVSFHRICGWTGEPYDREGRYTLAPQLEQAIREMQLPMTRFYGVGDEPFGVEGGLDRVVEVCRRVDVPLDHVVVELEEQSSNNKLASDLWSQAVRYAQQKGYAVRYWEVSNEPYSGIWSAADGKSFPTPDDYIAHAKAVSAAIKQVRPDAQVGVAINFISQPWGSYVLKQAAGAYDFVVGHYYSPADANGASMEQLALTENYRLLDSTLATNALIRSYNPGREVYQYDTEWGMASSGPKGEVADDVVRNANIIGTVHRAVRLIYYAREGMLRGASSWQMLSRVKSPGFGVLAQEVPDQRFLIYWLYYYFNRHLGAWALETDGTAPYYTPAGAAAVKWAGPQTPMLATGSEDGKTVYLVIANGSASRGVPCRVTLRGFADAKAEGVVLSQGDLEGSPLLARKEDAISTLSAEMSAEVLSCQVPARSVVFVKIVRK